MEKKESYLDLLEEAKEVFVIGEDEETKAENLEEINKWQQEFVELENFTSWQEHDVSKKLIEKIHHEFVEVSFKLAIDQSIDDSERKELFAKQKAMLFVLSLISQDTKENIKALYKEIRFKIAKFGG